MCHLSGRRGQNDPDHSNIPFPNDLKRPFPAAKKWPGRTTMFRKVNMRSEGGIGELTRGPKKPTAVS
jgi:hypothetical protein